jgi:hypothetical protein
MRREDLERGPIGLLALKLRDGVLWAVSATRRKATEFRLMLGRAVGRAMPKVVREALASISKGCGRGCLVTIYIMRVVGFLSILLGPLLLISVALESIGNLLLIMITWLCVKAARITPTRWRPNRNDETGMNSGKTEPDGVANKFGKKVSKRLDEWDLRSVSSTNEGPKATEGNTPAQSNSKSSPHKTEFSILHKSLSLKLHYSTLLRLSFNLTARSLKTAKKICFSCFLYSLSLFTYLISFFLPWTYASNKPRTGCYYMLHCPELSRWQHHPFSLTYFRCSDKMGGGYGPKDPDGRWLRDVNRDVSVVNGGDTKIVNSDHASDDAMVDDHEPGGEQENRCGSGSCSSSSSASTFASEWFSLSVWVCQYFRVLFKPKTTLERVNAAANATATAERESPRKEGKEDSEDLKEFIYFTFMIARLGNWTGKLHDAILAPDLVVEENAAEDTGIQTQNQTVIRTESRPHLKEGPLFSYTRQKTNLYCDGSPSCINLSLLNERLTFSLDGPFIAPASALSSSSASVLVGIGAGVGVTPFFSFISQLVERATAELDEENRRVEEEKRRKRKDDLLRKGLGFSIGEKIKSFPRVFGSPGSVAGSVRNSSVTSVSDGGYSDSTNRDSDIASTISAQSAPPDWSPLKPRVSGPPGNKDTRVTFPSANHNHHGNHNEQLHASEHHAFPNPITNKASPKKSIWDSFECFHLFWITRSASDFLLLAPLLRKLWRAKRVVHELRRNADLPVNENRFAVSTERDTASCSNANSNRVLAIDLGTSRKIRLHLHTTVRNADSGCARLFELCMEEEWLRWLQPLRESASNESDESNNSAAADENVMDQNEKKTVNDEKATKAVRQLPSPVTSANANLQLAETMDLFNADLVSNLFPTRILRQEVVAFLLSNFPHSGRGPYLHSGVTALSSLGRRWRSYAPIFGFSEVQAEQHGECYGTTDLREMLGKLAKREREKMRPWKPTTQSRSREEAVSSGPSRPPQVEVVKHLQRKSNLSGNKDNTKSSDSKTSPGRLKRFQSRLQKQFSFSERKSKPADGDARFPQLMTSFYRRFSDPGPVNIGGNVDNRVQKEGEHRSVRKSSKSSKSKRNSHGSSTTFLGSRSGDMKFVNANSSSEHNSIIHANSSPDTLTSGALTSGLPSYSLYRRPLSALVTYDILDGVLRKDEYADTGDNHTADNISDNLAANPDNKISPTCQGTSQGNAVPAAIVCGRPDWEAELTLISRAGATGTFGERVKEELMKNNSCDETSSLELCSDHNLNYNSSPGSNFKATPRSQPVLNLTSDVCVCYCGPDGLRRTLQDNIELVNHRNRILTHTANEAWSRLTAAVAVDQSHGAGHCKSDRINIPMEQSHANLEQTAGNLNHTVSTSFDVPVRKFHCGHIEFMYERFE